MLQIVLLAGKFVFLIILYTFVSSKHVLFEATPSGLLVEDLLSTNGTQVNGADISQPTLLSQGDRVEVGDTIFRVEVR
jgi:pSer/pThr/pTyr-binding forkhead associated (FHA) protein